MQKKNAEKQALEDNKSDIGWGSQIRSYVLDDARIKDLRTGVENACIIENVRTDLTSPADVGLVVLQRLFLSVFLLHLKLVQLRFHLLHRLIFVLVLRTVISLKVKLQALNL